MARISLFRTSSWIQFLKRSSNSQLMSAVIKDLAFQSRLETDSANHVYELEGTLPLTIRVKLGSERVLFDLHFCFEYQFDTLPSLSHTIYKAYSNREPFCYNQDTFIYTVRCRCCW